MKKVFLCLCILSSINVIAQRSIGADGFIGKVLEHKKGLFFEIPKRSLGANLWVHHQLDGSKAWHHYWGLPRIEGLVTYMNFGNQDTLGSAIAMAPGIVFTLKKWKKSTLLLHYNTGISYLNKPFDPVTNINNNAIGSHVNNISRLKLSIERSIKSNLAFTLGASFNHFSNGLTSSPNSGINTYGFNIGLKRKIDKGIELKEKPDFQIPRKIGYSLLAGIGASEHSNFGGPNYPIYFTSLGMYWRFAHFQRLHVGVEYEYSTKVYELELANFRPSEEAQKKATRTLFYVAEELMFGPVSMRWQLGFYTPFKSDYSGEPFYIKIMTLYHPPIKPLGQVKPFVGMMLKTHFAVAEYIAVTTGVTF